MRKRQTEPVAPSPLSDSPTGARPDEETSCGMMAVQRRDQAQTDDAAAADQPRASAEPGAAASQSASPTAAVSPFSRLAAVELQLIMRCCDQSTLIALARCSRFALAAASHPFVWQPLSPIALQCDWPMLLSNSLLRHADLSITWRLRFKAAVSGDQVAALAALPRLRGLAVKSVYYPATGPSVHLSDEGAVQLFEALGDQIDNGGALTNLSVDCRELRQAGVAALATFVRRSRTLTTLRITDSSGQYETAASDTLVPLASALAQCSTLTCLEVASRSARPGVFRTLAAVVQQSSSLTTFRLDRLRRYTENAEALTAAVAHSRSLTDLQLPACEIGDAEMDALVAASEKCGRIRRLDASLNRIGSAGAAALARLLSSGCCALTSLDCSENGIGREGAMELAAALRTNRTLTELRLCRNSIGTQGTAAVASALRLNPHIHLRVLALNGCSIDQPAAAALAAALRHSSALERLEVSGCSLTDQGMAVLAIGIGRSRSLQRLDLSYNQFGVAGAAALAAAIGACPALTSLDVCGTMIRDAGLAALAPVLVRVRHLELDRCSLASPSGEPLAWLIRHSGALESLHVDDNNYLGEHAIALMAAALQPSSSLRTLHAQDCDADVDGAAALADALRRGWRASELRLDSDESIDDSGALALAAAMEQLGSRCTLTTLSLSGCALTAAGALALVRAATATPRLRSLDLCFNASIKAADRPALITAGGPQPHFVLGLLR